jgi:hypothetical protein
MKVDLSNFGDSMKLIQFNLLLLALLTTTLVACESSDDEESSTSGSVVPGVIDAAGGFNVKVDNPAGTNYYIHKDGDFNASCVVPIGTTTYADKDISCILEVEELEGAFNGIDMVMNVPPAMCTYVSYYPYFYFGRDYGVGPTAATVRFDTEGTYVGGTVTGPGYITSSGEVKCNYDYTPSTGPDCCYGSYTKTTINNFGSTDPDLPQTTVVQAGVEWPGKPGNCAAGAGATIAPRDDNYGLPVRTYYFKPNGFNDLFATGKRTVIDGDSSLYYANFYSGTIPTAFKDGAAFEANPYYEWTCLDDAHEMTARIRVQIREWNEIDEFALESTGNPDTSGAETDWGTAVNDFPDWLDIVNAGNLFPGMP